MSKSPTVPVHVLHILRPQREGAIGGADLHLLDLASAQQNHGRHKPLLLVPGASQHYLDRLTRAGLSHVATSLSLPWLWSLPERCNIDIVHAHGYEANYLMAAMRTLLPSWRELAAVVTAHGWIETTPELRIKSAADRWTGRTAAVRISSAHAHAHRLNSRRGEVAVIHNGVPQPDPERLQRLARDQAQLRASLNVPPTGPLVGTVGRLSPEKGIDLFIRAARHVLKAVPSTHFLVVGGGSELQSLRTLAHREQVSENITFTGLLDDVTPVYAALDLLVQPSWTEGSPRTVVEAMGHAVPVLATPVGDTSVLLDHGRAGTLTAPDESRIATDITALLNDADQARTLAERGKDRFLSHYTIDAMRERVEVAYDAAIRNTGIQGNQNAPDGPRSLSTPGRRRPVGRRNTG